MAFFGLNQLFRNSRGEVFAEASVGDCKRSANRSARPLRHLLQRAHVFTQPGPEVDIPYAGARRDEYQRWLSCSDWLESTRTLQADTELA